SCQRRPPERFNVAVHRALSPCPYCQDRNDAHRCGQNERATPLIRGSQTGHTRRSERNWSDASQILIMISYKRVAKCEKHDKPEHRAQGHNEKCGSDLEATPHIAPQKVEQRAQHDSREQPYVIQQVRRRDVPSRINECQVRWPDEFAQIKPNSPARDENPLGGPQERKDGSAGTLVVTLPPH